MNRQRDLTADQMEPRVQSRQAHLLRTWRKASPLGMVTALFLVVYYGIVFVIPFGTSIWLSFQNWDFIDNAVFVGLQNYTRAASDPYFWGALKNTVLFSIVEIGVGMVLGVLVAFLLSRLGGRLQRAFLGIYYLPVIIPTIVTVLLWQFLYLPQGGVFNGMLSAIGLSQQQFLNSPDQALWSVTAMVIWAELGTGIVLFLASINNVPQQVLEAAYLDGAGLWTLFWHIIAPLIKPVLYYQVIVSVIGTVQMFTQFYLLQGPGFSTRTLAVYTYELGFQSMDLGYGAAVSVIIFLLLLGATAFQLRRYKVTWEY